jgi:4-hydroxy-tetrahydrodipicolinate synthase
MIKGTGVAIVTPFDKNGSIDFNSLEKLINHIVEGGVDFIVALGTTSEAVTLTNSEKQELMSSVIKITNNRVPIFMGLGGNNTASVVELLKATDFTGISGILSVTPYYNKPNQRGIYAHFAEIAKNCPLPIILYNVPGRTSSNISAETCLKLANDFENIVAVKEASGDMSQIMEILRLRPEGFSVLSGDDALTFPMMTLGADGVISVLANATPAEFSKMVNLLNDKKDIELAQKLHYSLLPLVDLLFADGNPAGIKATLEILEIMENNLRLPMVKINKEHYDLINSFICNFKQL